MPVRHLNDVVDSDDMLLNNNKPEQFFTFTEAFYKAGWPETNSDDELKDQLTVFGDATISDSPPQTAEIVSDVKSSKMNKR